jgi:hypothetical protein
MASMRSRKNPGLRSRRGRVRTWPVLPALAPGHRGRIPAVAGVPVLEEDGPAGQNQTRPPMYEMGGLARPRRARSGQLPGFAGAARRPPVPGIHARDRFPGSSHVPGVAPEVVPVSSGESILTASADTAQEPEVNYFWFLCYPHGIHRKNGYPPANSQAVHKSPCVTPGTPRPVVAACNRLVLSLRLCG